MVALDGFTPIAGQRRAAAAQAYKAVHNAAEDAGHRGRPEKSPTELPDGIPNNLLNFVMAVSSAFAVVRRCTSTHLEG